ncbi:glycosyltransferase [Ferruginibacter paludis]|jgi:glycosyltransferase involved in cell wall biosynthesis|uniref:glycosyltransferase n=1 Tax=Ferruginibacter paludis TaxID=1310417 RepID=UPI0025B4213F|nr:glycosyltransferase [Ferruginibacter paludis]MDN3656961.1 glycosyltransferase [Ferruginibacter paludis]
MMHVVWLVSWYPGRRDAFTGDFIERHAQAVSHYAKVTVLAVLKDELLPAGKVEIEKTTGGNLTVYRCYYGKSKWPPLIESIFSVKQYFFLQRKLFQRIQNEEGRPSLIHVQVAMKAGLLALLLKKKIELPYVVTEHWTGYYRQSKPSVYDSGFVYRWLNKKILKQADLFLPVTKDLGETVSKNFVSVNYLPVPNVADTNLFYYQPLPSDVFRFIHPSVMTYQKNPEDILQACLQLKNKGYRFELQMIGSNNAMLVENARRLGLLDQVVFFRPVIAYSAVADAMRQSSALLLFSRFENLPCVILEALCCGLPVISSRVGGIAEVVNETNGILVESENVEQLVNAMQKMIDQYSTYNQPAIAQKAAALYSYNTVGSQYFSIYKKIVQGV